MRKDKKEDQIVMQMRPFDPKAFKKSMKIVKQYKEYELPKSPKKSDFEEMFRLKESADFEQQINGILENRWYVGIFRGKVEEIQDYQKRIVAFFIYELTSRRADNHFTVFTPQGWACGFKIEELESFADTPHDFINDSRRWVSSGKIV